VEGTNTPSPVEVLNRSSMPKPTRFS